MRRYREALGVMGVCSSGARCLAIKGGFVYCTRTHSHLQIADLGFGIEAD